MEFCACLGHPRNELQLPGQEGPRSRFAGNSSYLNWVVPFDKMDACWPLAEAFTGGCSQCDPGGGAKASRTSTPTCFLTGFILNETIRL